MQKIYAINSKLPEDDFRTDSNLNILSLFENQNLKLLEDIKDDNFCFNYALQDNNIDNCEEALEILEDKYINIPLKEAKKGDIISFHKEIIQVRQEKVLVNVCHFGIIFHTSGILKKTKITSKWGRYGVYLTDFENLPEFYGKYIKIWRKKD